MIAGELSEYHFSLFCMDAASWCTDLDAELEYADVSSLCRTIFHDRLRKAVTVLNQCQKILQSVWSVNFTRIPGNVGLSSTNHYQELFLYPSAANHSADPQDNRTCQPAPLPAVSPASMIMVILIIFFILILHASPGETRRALERPREPWRDHTTPGETTRLLERPSVVRLPYCN